MIDYEHLSLKAKNIRRSVIEMIYNAKSGHPGGALSCVDIITALYFGRMNIDTEDPMKKDRDRFVMSKGHSSPAIYGALYERGFLIEEELASFRKFNGTLQGSPDMLRVNGIDISTGSLGMGLSAACGMALASKIENVNYNVYALLGDGELQEGMVWEAAMFANQYKLDNLMAIIDMNGLQINGSTDDVMSLGSITKKFTSFGWYVIEIDGHDFDQIFGAFNIFDKVDSKPVLVIANTIKGKGVSFMENKCEWHSNIINKEDYKIAMDELR
ncbi:transketolase [Peptostreptococcus canis]|uniref:Transketolase n=1 Tax=Peptostreptococcus canis TaxID=1159213 RepID=A0ABR6TJ78_9FIRM|nr:transketolase [Peptostreptococcus canis]MBC2575288.1 transketolase [Peptostreptococcus canis]MBP1997529.1 transketolase [Peptostreptococcus canis]